MGNQRRAFKLGHFPFFVREYFEFSWKHQKMREGYG